MGQQESRDDCGRCCTTRVDKHSDAARFPKLAPQENLSGDCFLDPSPPESKEHNFRNGSNCDITCIHDGREVSPRVSPPLSGDKCLIPKLQNLRSSSLECEAMKRAHSLLKSKLEAAASGDLPLPKSPRDNATVPGWVHQLAIEIQMPAKMINEACFEVFGFTERSINAQEFLTSYADVLAALARLAEQELDTMKSDLDKLQDNIAIAEDLIAVCFDKMDEEGNDAITKEQFVGFICSDDVESRVNPKDAESFFLSIADGKPVLGFEQFKTGITSNCLKVLYSTMDLRRSNSQKFRDWLF